MRGSALHRQNERDGEARGIIGECSNVHQKSMGGMLVYVDWTAVYRWIHGDAHVVCWDVASFEYMVCP